MPDYRFEFRQVGRNQRRTAINAEILALGVGQNRDAVFTPQRDQRLMVHQSTFAVVRQNHHLDPTQQPANRIQ